MQLCVTVCCMASTDIATGIPIADYQNGDFAGVDCKYCPTPATTVYTSGRGKSHESMAFCDNCKPRAGVELTASGPKPMLQVWFLQLRRKDGVTSRYASEFRTRDRAAAAAATIMERHGDVFASVSIGYGDSLSRTA